MVLQPAVDRDVDPLQRIDDADEPVEIGAHVVVHGDAQVVEQRLLKQARPAALVPVQLADHVGKVDPAHPEFGDVDV